MVAISNNNYFNSCFIKFHRLCLVCSYPTNKHVRVSPIVKIQYFDATIMCVRIVFRVRLYYWRSHMRLLIIFVIAAVHNGFLSTTFQKKRVIQFQLIWRIDVLISFSLFHCSPNSQLPVRTCKKNPLITVM